MELFIYPEQTVRRKLPVNLQKEDLVLFQQELVKNFGSVYAKRYKNVKILSNGAVCKIGIKSGLYFSQSIPHKKGSRLINEAKLHLKSFSSLFSVRKKLNVKKGLLLTDQYSVMFFHWFADVLQKLEAIETSDLNIKDYILLIPSTVKSHYTDLTLNRYNIKYKIIENNEIASVNELLHIPLISPSGNFRPELAQNLRERFKNNRVRDEKSKRVYITRKFAPNRKLLNEDKLKPILDNLNFTIVAMEQLSFEEQLDIVVNADVLVSIHGAGLSHMLWMDTGSNIIEIRFKDDKTHNCYYSLASDLNHNYYYFCADSLNKNSSTLRSDLYLNVESFEKFLTKMLEK
jgi:capsular polysaccharide biosynthesis protein